METTPESHASILSTIGLIVQPNDLQFDDQQFTKYIAAEYLNSERRQTDDNYRMFELTLLHKSSGLRITYTTTEGYYGDWVDYKVIGMFIVTVGKKELKVMDVDFSKKEFITPTGRVAFVEVDKDVSVNGNQ